MATKLSLYNLAFAHLTEPSVTELGGDPPSPNVVKANAQWDQLLEDALTRAAWLCCQETRRLALMAPPVGGWQDWKYPHRFQLPNTVLKVWAVEDGDTFRWARGVEIDGNGAVKKVIKAEVGTALNVTLLVRRPVEALTPLLVLAMSYDLASRLAGPIQSSEAKMKAFADKANEAYLMAEGTEASEEGGQDPMIGESSLNRARASAL